MSVFSLHMKYASYKSRSSCICCQPLYVMAVDDVWKILFQFYWKMSWHIKFLITHVCCFFMWAVVDILSHCQRVLQGGCEPALITHLKRAKLISPAARPEMSDSISMGRGSFGQQVVLLPLQEWPQSLYNITAAQPTWGGGRMHRPTPPTTLWCPSDWWKNLNKTTTHSSQNQHQTLPLEKCQYLSFTSKNTKIH